jgi:1,5-anhydro-D-fructose reductase (1,5-anhydro-D-mannitol-forming)
LPDKIKFAQLSFWFSHARGICAAAQKHPNVDLSCIWDGDPTRGKAAADKFGIEYVGDLDEVLQRTTSMRLGSAQRHSFTENTSFGLSRLANTVW